MAFSSAKVFSSAPVQLLTDSASDIPEEIAAELGIRVLSFSIAVEGKSYLEREDFSEGSFLELLSRVKEIPKPLPSTRRSFSTPISFAPPRAANTWCM